MKADLYIQGHFWATIDVPGDSVIALLAKGMIAYAESQSRIIAQHLDLLENVSCTISLRFKHTVLYETKPQRQDLRGKPL